MQRPIKTKAIISKIKNLTEDVKHFELKLEDNFNFKAGQFINLSLEEDGKNIKRPYSIASHPLNKNKIELCIKLVKDGLFTPILWKKKEGDEIEIMGPLGLFNTEKIKKIENETALTSDIKPTLVFIGTGTGIAPLRSIIKDLIAQEKEYQIQLIFGMRFENSHLYNQEFKDLEILSPNFKYIPVTSRPSESWQGRIGHVQDNLNQIDPLNSQIFICGLPEMVNDVTKKLELRGVNKENIFSEKY